jgi:hypothetical protein
MTGSSKTQSVTVSVAGRQELKLVVTAGGDNFNYDHADWASAFVSTQAAQPTPAPTPGGGGGTVALSDDFNDNVRDASKWVVGTLNDGPSAQGPLVKVLEQSQRLEIFPKPQMTTMYFNGYVSASAWNLTAANASVEVLQVSNLNEWADTVFAIGIDSNNWYRIVHEHGNLYFQQEVAGVKTSTNISYDSTRHHYWRFRHDVAADQIVFETSADGATWTVQRSVSRQIDIRALRLELSAGTFNYNVNQGPAIFDNVRLDSMIQ